MDALARTRVYNTLLNYASNLGIKRHRQLEDRALRWPPLIRRKKAVAANMPRDTNGIECTDADGKQKLLTTVFTHCWTDREKLQGELPCWVH